MITKKYKIYDKGPEFMVLLLETEPGQDPPLVPRYQLNRWVYKNDVCVDQPEKYFKEENYLSVEYSDFDEAMKVTRQLNDLHWEDFRKSESYKAYK
jgi:hypothetical protein